MTFAFDTFLRQHAQTGSAKADGYSRDAFIGLEEHERQNVFRLLVEELPWSAAWLFLVDPAQATAVATALEATWRGNPHEATYLLQRQLVHTTGDLAFQAHMIDDYARYAGRTRPQVIDAISATPLNAAVVAFYRHVILAEVQPSAVARASRHLLDALGYPRRTDAETILYQHLLDGLRSNDLSARQDALAHVATRVAAVLSAPA